MKSFYRIFCNTTCLLAIMLGSLALKNKDIPAEIFYFSWAILAQLYCIKSILEQNNEYKNEEKDER